MHAHPRCPALSAILRGDDRDRERRGVRRARRACAGQPALRTLPPYYDDPLYIDALRANLTRQLAALDFAPERLLLSFHGMPQRTLELGDPYHCHCQKTARLLSAKRSGARSMSPSSRASAAPSGSSRRPTDARGLSSNGVKRIAVAAPGFSADCLETLEELGIRGRETFLHAGGEHFALLDCLNDLPEGMTMLRAADRARTCGLARAVISAADRRGERSWLEWRSSRAERAGSAKRSASRLRTWACRSRPITPAMRSARANSATAPALQRSNGTCRLRRLPRGRGQVEAELARSTCWSTMPGSPATRR